MGGELLIGVATFDQPWIGDAGLGVAEALDLDGVLPAVAEVVDVSQRLCTDVSGDGATVHELFLSWNHGIVDSQSAGHIRLWATCRYASAVDSSPFPS